MGGFVGTWYDPNVHDSLKCVSSTSVEKRLWLTRHGRFQLVERGVMVVKGVKMYKEGVSTQIEHRMSCFFLV